MGKKKINKQREVNRLFDLEVDEVSLVDKPAIGETFIKVQKRLNKTGSETVGKLTLKKSMNVWEKGVKKAVDQENTHCSFCQITKEEEAAQLGMGLLCGVCFNCAVDRHDKGVFDLCIDGTFDFEKYKEENPDDVAFQKSEDEEGEEQEEDGEEGEGEEESEEEQEKNEDETAEDEEGDQESDAVKSLQTRIEKAESAIKDLPAIKEMLEGSLALHEQAAMALNEVMSLTFGALDLTFKLLEEQAEQAEALGREAPEERVEQVAELQDAIKSVVEDINKAGAKISNSRLNVLRDVVDKLSQLISSVSEEKTEDKKKSLSVLETMKTQIEELQEDLEGKDKVIEDLKAKIDMLDSLGDGSSGIEDDEDLDNEDESEDSQKSVFSNLDVFSEVKKRASKLRSRD